MEKKENYAKKYILFPDGQSSWCSRTQTCIQVKKKHGLGTAAETLTEQSPDKATENPLTPQKVGSSVPGLLQRTFPVRSRWKRTPASSLLASV